MMGVQSQKQYTTLTDLVNGVQEVLNTYRRDVLSSIADHIDECADIFITEVKKVSPPDDGPGIGGHYRDKWKKKKLRKQKFSVIVGNTKKVKRHKKDAEPAIPLINLLEFNTGSRRKPHVSTALANSKDQIINTITNGIQGVK